MHREYGTESGLNPDILALGRYAKPLVYGGGEAGMWKEDGCRDPDHGTFDFVRGESMYVPFFFSIYEGPDVQPTHIITSLNLSKACQGKVIMPNSWVKKLRLT